MELLLPNGKPEYICSAFMKILQKNLVQSVELLNETSKEKMSPDFKINDLYCSGIA